jgi:hypothetical protein
MLKYWFGLYNQAQQQIVYENWNFLFALADASIYISRQCKSEQVDLE